MPTATSILGGRIRAEAEHRDGICVKCGIHFEWGKDPDDIDRRLPCAECGGEIGRLISRQVTTPLPKMPESPEVPDPNCHPCIYKYIRDFDKWAKECRKLMEGHRKILEYHHRRVVFAEKYRDEIIPEKYRTGTPSPTTGFEAMEEMKLLKKLEKEVKNGARAGR